MAASQELMDLVMNETLVYSKTAKQALDKIKEISHKNFTIEVCGFLGYDSSKKQYVVKLERNVSDKPKDHFMINPLNYLIFKEDYEMIAVFHSHINGDEKESDFDVTMAENCCQAFLIYSLNTKKINIYTPKNLEGNVNKLERVKAIK